MESPYLVKRFVSSDKVPGASTFFYWIYSPKDNKKKIGLGQFFEVVSTEVDEKTCEYISKRVWEAFLEKYAGTNFEQALQKASFTLISVLRELQIAQIDINFAFWVVQQKKEEKYSLELAIIGQADVILIRESNPTFLHEYAPANEDLKNLKYVELEVAKQDKILVSNKYLLENLLKTDVLELSSDYALLETLKEAETNFPGDQGVFLLGIEIQENLKDNKGSIIKQSNLAKKEKSVEKEDDILHFPGRRKTLADILGSFNNKVVNKISPFIGRIKDSFVGFFKKRKKFGSKQREETESIEPNEQKKITAITSDLSKYITDKSEIVNEGDNEQLKYLKDADNKNSSTVLPRETAISPSRLRLKRVWWGRLYLFFAGIISPILRRRSHRSLYVGGKVGVSKTPLKQKVLYLIGAIFLVFLFFNLIKSYHNKKEEMRQTTVFIQKEVIPVIKMYNEQVKQIELTDPDHILELCMKTADETLSKIDEFRNRLGYIENKQNVSSYISQLKNIKNQCSIKYDKVHHIVRIKNAKVVKDFAADLGVETDIVSIIEQKGYVYAVDRGKKAVYRVNPDTGRAVKLEDPDGLLRDPVEIGVNKDHILVCDRISGILEFKDNKFKAVVGTSPEALGNKCVLVRGFYTNAYFVLEDKSKLYKSAGVDTGYALPIVYIKNIKQVLDVAIDGNIYVLRKLGDDIKLERYFQGVLDSSFRFKEELSGYTKLYSNPSGNFPVYVFNPSVNTILVVEKPTAKKHPGYGIVLKRIVLDNRQLFSHIDDFAINLGVDSNKEEYLYFLSKNVLWRVGLQGK